jgi:hypothetical protein
MIAAPIEEADRSKIEFYFIYPQYDGKQKNTFLCIWQIEANQFRATEYGKHVFRSAGRPLSAGAYGK